MWGLDIFLGFMYMYMYSNPQAIYFFTMSDSELFLVKETVEVEENVSKSSKVQRGLKLKLTNELGRDTAHSSSTSPESCNIQHREDIEREERYGGRSIAIESKQMQLESLSMDQVEVEDDDSGFRTPTSTEHRNSLETNQCPPAPRKPKPSLKRKASQSRFIYRNPPLDVSEEVESLFSSIPQSTDDHHSAQNNFKKTRKEDTE